MRHVTCRNGIVGGLAIALLLFLTVTANGANPGDDYPNKPIEYATHVPPGGSMDVVGRVIQKVLAEEKILSQPLVIVNKQGSGGAVSYGYVFERKGNPYVILAVTSNSFLGTPLREKLPYNHKSFTPICNFIADGSVLVVKGDSPYKTIDDLIADARKRPKKLNQSGASFTSNENMMGKSIQKVKGVQWDFISFPGDAEATLAVLGGNADFQFGNPSGIIEHVKAGKLRVLLSGAPSRYAMFKDIPTIQEAGLGVPVVTYRGFVGPPDMPEYAAKKLEAAFKKVFDSKPFQKYMDDTLQQPFWLSSKEYGKFLQEESDRTKGWFDELGLLKKK